MLHYLFFFPQIMLFSDGHAPYSVSFKWRPFCPPPPGHGYCSCGRCICEEGWFGKLCQFPRSCDMSDAQSKELCETSDGVICSGKGRCFYIQITFTIIITKYITYWPYLIFVILQQPNPYSRYRGLGLSYTHCFSYALILFAISYCLLVCSTQ